jgi:hypothetical protein
MYIVNDFPCFVSLRPPNRVLCHMLTLLSGLSTPHELGVNMILQIHSQFRVYPKFVLLSVELGLNSVELRVHSVELGVHSVELGVYSINSEYTQLKSEYNQLNSEYNWFNLKWALDLYWDILWDECRVEGPGGMQNTGAWAFGALGEG